MVEVMCTLLVKLKGLLKKLVFDCSVRRRLWDQVSGFILYLSPLGEVCLRAGEQLQIQTQRQKYRQKNNNSVTHIYCTDTFSHELV